jgi:hemophore-related protein
MKRITAVVTAGAFGVAGFGLAVPALASADSGTSTASTAASTSTAVPLAAGKAPAPLTSDQQDSILDFLAAHPQLAQAMAARAKGWDALVTAHPEIKAELTKVLALPADQRKAELKKWLAANPAAKAALQDYRQGLKEQRLTKQKDRLDRRLQRLQDKTSGT